MDSINSINQTLHTPEVYDFRQYDRIWQRVAPGLEPYPAAPAPKQAPAPAPSAPAAPAAPVTASTPSSSASASSSDPVGYPVTLPALGPEGQLPGADPNPCCMGSAAAEMLTVLTGFAEESLEEQRQLQALSRQAPSWARQRLRELAAERGAQAKRLTAVYYLITGTCFHPMYSAGRICPQPWCPALRERYHAAACGGLNYIRASEGTTDPCLAKLLKELSEEAYSQASALLAMLERSLRT